VAVEVSAASVIDETDIARTLSPGSRIDRPLVVGGAALSSSKG